METQTTAPSSSRSTFVTVTAWVFIVIASFSTLISVLQNVMLNIMTSFENIPPPRGPLAEQMPAYVGFMAEHVRLFFLSFLIVSVATLAAALGLLRRKNWARLTLIGILSIGVAWNVAAFILQQRIFSSADGVRPNAPSAFSAEFDQMTSVMLVFSTVMAAGFALLFAWLIKRLLSRPVRAEFNQGL